MKKLNVKMLPASLALAVALVSAPAVSDEPDPKAELIALADQMQPFSMRMLGPPVSTAEWGLVVEPFWTETIKELGAGKINVTLNSVTEINVPPSEALQLVSQGAFDMTNMIANYGSGDVPALDGFDLPGVATSTESIKKVLAVYEDSAEDALKKRYQLDLLGVGMSGPQSFFCKGDINSLEDLKGKKVRVSSSMLAELVQGLGAAPVTMAFGELVPALQRGVIDCVVTGTMSGNTAKLYEVSDTLYTLIVGWAPTIQVINSNSLAKLNDEQRDWLKKLMDYYYREISDAIQTKNVKEGIWCNTGDERCTMSGTAGVMLGHMNLSEPSTEDLTTVREIVQEYVLPAYGNACNEDCLNAWNETVGDTVEMSIAIE